MQIRYCIKCGALINLKDNDKAIKKMKDPDVCESCKAGKKPAYRGARDSAMIPRKKLDGAGNAPEDKKD